MEDEVTDKRKRGRPFLKKQIDLNKVLDIATKSFANNGFGGTTMKAIAEEAGYTKAVLHYHFANKENLWKEALLHLNGKLLKRYEDLHHYLKDLEGLSALKAYTRQLVYFSAEHPEFYKLIFHELCNRTERATWLYDNITIPSQKLYIEENNKIKGEHLVIQKYPFANVESVVYAAVNAFFIHPLQIEKMYGVNPLEKEEIERHADFVIDLIFAKYCDE